MIACPHCGSEITHKEISTMYADTHPNVTQDEAFEAFMMFEPATFAMTNEEIELLTRKQQNAMWLYLTRLAKAMNDAGLDMRTAIRMPIMPTKDNCKHEMWDRVQAALYPEVKSSRHLSKRQVNDVYMNLDRGTGELFGIHVEFPSEEEMRRLGELRNAKTNH